VKDPLPKTGTLRVPQKGVLPDANLLGQSLIERIHAFFAKKLLCFCVNPNGKLVDFTTRILVNCPNEEVNSPGYRLA
jgi:hypothetical protein